MKFLCTKVKPFWLTLPDNEEKVINAGLVIRESFIGIEIKSNNPTNEEYNIVNNAIEKLFEENKKVFPVRLIDL